MANPYLLIPILCEFLIIIFYYLVFLFCALIICACFELATALGSLPINKPNNIKQWQATSSPELQAREGYTFHTTSIATRMATL